MKELGLSSKMDHKIRMEKWREYVIHKMTNKVTLVIVPLFFNYANETLISTYVEENCAEFIQKSKKDSYFVLTCKIFQYPNRVISVRLLIAMFYKVSEAERDDSIDKDLYQTDVGDLEEEDDEKEKLIGVCNDEKFMKRRNMLLEEK
jgi:centrosomal protein CEP76